MTNTIEAIIECSVGIGWLIAHIAAFACLLGGAVLIWRAVL